MEFEVSDRGEHNSMGPNGTVTATTAVCVAKGEGVLKTLRLETTDEEFAAQLVKGATVRIDGLKVIPPTAEEKP